MSATDKQDTRPSVTTLIQWTGLGLAIVVVIVSALLSSGTFFGDWTSSEWLAGALVLANLILVGVTTFYAIQTRTTASYTKELAKQTTEMAAATQATVEEMRESRRLGVRPKLSLDVQMIDPTFGVITVTNIGQGAALDVEARLEMSFEDKTTQTRDIQVKTFLAGETHQYLPSHPKSDKPLEMNDFAKLTSKVKLTGILSDVYGTTHKFDDDLDVRTLWDLLTNAERRFTEDPLRKIGRELEQTQHWIKERFKAPPTARDDYGPDEAPF